MNIWYQVGVLSLGGAFGVNARFWLGVWINRWASPQFPWATWIINVTGSFAIGFLTTWLARWLPHPSARLLVVTGFLGGYTTYSTFAFESLTLWERGERGLSLAYIVSTVAVGFLAATLGVILARPHSLSRPDPTPPSLPTLSSPAEDNP
ncbi:MAG: putative fluoride ion transporter CrcB [Isosphaeraceae bacterium]|jgi:CrcB protein|nr:MAG: putative fluoride ion transporter CrcB [Isosphaeraceae bacterium]